MSFVLDDWVAGDPITAARLQKEKEALQMIANFLGAGGNGDIFQTLGGTAFKSTGTAVAPNLWVMMKITGYEDPTTLGGGVYWGTVQTRNSAALGPESSTMTPATHWQDDGDPVVVYNMFEQGIADSHLLAADTYTLAMSGLETATVGEASYDVYYLVPGISMGCP
jgi:hypothetical protein